MANARTILKTTLKREGKPVVTAMLRRSLLRCRGDVDRIAWEFDISRRHAYRMLVFCGLWPEVEAARAAPPVALPLARALQEL